MKTSINNVGESNLVNLRYVSMNFYKGKHKRAHRQFRCGYYTVLKYDIVKNIWNGKYLHAILGTRNCKVNASVFVK